MCFIYQFIKQFIIIESHCRYLTEFYFTDSTRYGIIFFKIINLIEYKILIFNQIYYFEENYSIPSRISKIKLSQIFYLCNLLFDR